ncbi:MAG TPA: DNA-3-methyladenine glycosylase I [Microbacteriaceae bacterium]|jgi:DNA-3-methyladenine glycosylase I|nr:DNA-3-methyladenine glycosylase I [Microbacteriaceae bacterium]
MTEQRPAVVLGEDGISRCAWGSSDPEYRRYHDEEWGVELRGDRPLFEKLSLEGFQAGLSWITILRRRRTFRAAFHDFDIDRVAEMDDEEAEALMQNTGIIRNRAKIQATISNARIARELVRDHPGALDELLWGFAPTEPRARPRTFGDLPAVTPESTAMSKALRARGFKFVGPTTLYALMQSSGMVDDHVEGCWRAA